MRPPSRNRKPVHSEFEARNSTAVLKQNWGACLLCRLPANSCQTAEQDLSSRQAKRLESYAFGSLAGLEFSLLTAMKGHAYIIECSPHCRPGVYGLHLPSLT
mmetsp:Transcript_46828/g.100853  ORF Transcript_46828/g.100853 Transcript_46828/m.100853 type:complete len:102 (-) Transcript_46828:1516-1821(-)